MFKILLCGILLSGLVLADEDRLAGTWEVLGTQQALGVYNGGWYHYPVTTTLTLETSLDKSHQYLARWNMVSEQHKLSESYTFWCDGRETKFRCLDRAGAKQSFLLEFMSLTSAEVQDVVMPISGSSRSSAFKKVHGLVRGGSQYLKISNELYQDLKVHADEEKLTVEQWAMRTLKGFSDLLKMPGAKGRGATFILDQSRNYYSEPKK